ncbi:MAG: hypothetical protein QM728_04570 [Gordonia sp. (in: high G+C Gram-positive bacteria)]|uniref:hypothetical protein n=1 Tax=Gordonia sp. (in: high G+C Gram-positive bacteria) TaxID=84139 RepID=UPI0039E336BB
MTPSFARPLILLALVLGGCAPPAVAAPAPGAAPTAHRGDRIAITFVSDRQHNGPSRWFDSLNRPRQQTDTVLPAQSSTTRLWTSSLVYTAQRPAQRLTSTFTTGGGFARCVVLVNDKVRDAKTVAGKGARVTCAPG